MCNLATLAGPAAVLVTALLGQGQLRIAKQQAATARQQADTALDQLRYNLFEKRYAIYRDVQELIRLLANGGLQAVRNCRALCHYG